jgi:poly(A) polymerase
LLTRYHTGPDGKPVKKAVVYTQSEHGIALGSVDRDAVRILEKLRQNGHDAYIVGGAVRDLLLGREPKDYDIVTDAEPPRIKKLFYRSRIIGRRFRLVHVYAGPKIYEVSTFRSLTNGTIGNTYGTIDEDALRRDFSLNALYYDPLEGIIVDYVNGLKDIQAKRLVPVIPLKSIFTEDPVRMIRAVKYSVGTGFTIPLFTRLAMRKHAPELASASVSRLGEEALKIFGSGRARAIIETLYAYKLLGAFLPALSAVLDAGGADKEELLANLADLDRMVGDTGDKLLRGLLVFIIRLPVRKAGLAPSPDAHTAFALALNQAKEFLAPLTMPRIEIEEAVASVFVPPEDLGPLKKSRRRGRKKPAARPAADAADAPNLQPERARAEPARARAEAKRGRAAPAGQAPSGQAGARSDAAGGNAAGPKTPSGQGQSRSAKRRRRRREAPSPGERGAEGQDIPPA